MFFFLTMFQDNVWLFKIQMLLQKAQFLTVQLIDCKLVDVSDLEKKTGKAIFPKEKENATNTIEKMLNCKEKAMVRESK